jgi:bacteriocin-like protein
MSVVRTRTAINAHIELSEEELDKITGGGGDPTIVRD